MDPSVEYSPMALAMDKIICKQLGIPPFNPMSPKDTPNQPYPGDSYVTQADDVGHHTRDAFITKDSGSRRAFDTGSVRDGGTGKGRYDLVSPIALERLAQLYERGAQKYAARNWEKGQPLSVFMDCAMRHLQKHLAGHRDEDHLAAAAWNVFAMIHVEHQVKRGALPAALSDLPDYVGPTRFHEKARELSHLGPPVTTMPLNQPPDDRYDYLFAGL